MAEMLKPPATLLIAPTGHGKTYSLTSYLKAGLKTFVIVTEPTGVDTLLDACHEQKLPLDNLHWAVCKPGVETLDALVRQAEISNRKTAADMQKMENGLEKHLYQQYLKFLTTCQNFVCARTGESFGDITTWDASRALCIDSMSGINIMVARNQCGNRLTMTQPEFGICQNIIENLVNTFCGLNCFFTLTAHPEYERDEITGQQRIMVSSLGKKLAPKLPRFFSEVVWGQKEGKLFSWSTATTNVDTKNRILPIADNLKPSFASIVEGYNMRLKLLEVEKKEDVSAVSEEAAA